MKNHITQLLEICSTAETILLTGPIFPDGDSIGACLALWELLKNKTKAQVDLAGKVTFNYHWMSNIDLFKPDVGLRSSYDVAIVLDGDRHRLTKEITPIFQASKHTVLIDHHSSTDENGYTLSLLNSKASSTCEMLYHIMTEWQVALSTSLAEAIYTGFIFDTGGFRHSNTTPELLRLTANLLETGIEHSFITTTVLMQRQTSGLKLLEYCLSVRELLSNGRIQFAFLSQTVFQLYSCTQGDIEGLVDTLLYVVGVELACLGIEQPDGRVKISLRSRSEVNVAQLAKSLHPDGGGHVRAAGAMLQETLSEAKQRVPIYLQRALLAQQQ